VVLVSQNHKITCNLQFKTYNYLLLLKAENIEKTYVNADINTLALNKINLEVQDGEFLAIMGQSGCGKSTLLNLLGLLDLPTGGKLFFDDIDVASLSGYKRAELRKKHIGFVFQSFNLIDELSVYENVELPLVYQNIPFAERRKRVMEVLEKMEVAHKKDIFPPQLSGGLQQRVAVARAVVSKPRLLLADEPTGNLDSEHGQDVMQILTRLNEEGSTIIMVTHSSDYAAYSSRTIYMLDGQIVTQNIIK
jgi:putative ABC transport system ATP-binding protein